MTKDETLLSVICTEALRKSLRKVVEDPCNDLNVRNAATLFNILKGLRAMGA